MARRGNRSEKKRQRWGQIAIGLILVFLMVVSVAQVAINQDTGGSFTYNEVKYSVQNDFFVAKIDGEQQTFRYVPYDGNTTRALFQSPYGAVVVFNSNPAITSYLASAPYLAITFDPEMRPDVLPIIDGVRFELNQELGFVLSGVLKNSTAYPTLQYMDCPETTSEIPVVKLLLANTTSTGFANLTLEGSCITVLADPPGLAAMRDYILLGRQGVIPDE